jgi:hypothetical protein
MSPNRVTAVRVELRRPRKEDGLGGSWTATCQFAGRPWRFRFYGREWVFPLEDDKAWRDLTDQQRAQLRKTILAALENAQLADYHRQNRARRFRDTMRSNVGLALRDKTPTPLTTTVDSLPRQNPRESAPRRHTARTTRTGARSPPEDPSEPSPEAPPSRSPGGAGVASARLWAYVRRREAKGRLAFP